MVIEFNDKQDASILNKINTIIYKAADLVKIGIIYYKGEEF